MHVYVARRRGFWEGGGTQCTHGWHLQGWGWEVVCAPHVRPPPFDDLPLDELICPTSTLTHPPIHPLPPSSPPQAAAGARKAQRTAEHSMPRTTLPPLPDQTAGTRARPISAAIDKNRGLTPHR